MLEKKEYRKRYYETNKEKEIKRGKQWYKDNLIKCKENTRRYYEKNCEKLKKYSRQWHINNIEKAKEYQKQNQERRTERQRQWRKNNPERIKQYQKNSSEYHIQWEKDNPEKVKQYRNNQKENRKLWKNIRYKTDLKFNLNHKISGAILKSLKRDKNGNYWESLVGYTLNDLKERLKNTIPKGYNWNDCICGKLHIDHIVPKSAFNYTKPEHIDFKKCWALKNLRLLPAKENLEKGNKLEESFQHSLILTI